jgi:predicted negative regulator of RcsB-dependent stress response
MREWGMLIGFGLFVACTFAGFRYWTEYQADQPIAAQYRGFIDHLAANSAKANDYQQAYQRSFGRQTVASRHFEQVCAVMARMAESDGVNTDTYSSEIGYSCRRLARHFVSDELPSPKP